MRCLSALFVVAWVSGITFGAEKPSADKDTIELVEYAVKTPTADLAPGAVPPFMKVDPATLPEKLREPYESKKMELNALRKIAEGKRKPPIRRYDMEAPKCAEPVKGSPQVLRAWTQAGFVEASGDEVSMASAETKCTECELETEFTLQRMLWEEPGKGKSKKTRIRYFFSSADPIWFFIEAYRKNLNLTTGTPFFGIGGGPPHCH